MNNSWRRQYLRGVHAGLPVIPGFIPVGIAYAVMALSARFNAAETILMSVTVFAGASQMMAVGMYTQGAGMLAIILATFMLNLRHLIMSTCVIHLIRHSPLPVRLLASLGVTDESFGIFTTGQAEDHTAAYFFGLITVTYSAWIAGTALGVFASGLLPDVLTSSFSIALYAIFIGIMVPNLTRNLRLALLVLMTAGCNTALSQMMDSSWALILSTLICAALGVFFVDPDTEGKQEKAGQGGVSDAG